MRPFGVFTDEFHQGLVVFVVVVFHFRLDRVNTEAL